MNGEPLLRFIAASKERLLFKVFYWCARYGLAVTFILSGLRKFPGILFTTLPVDNPVGAYFLAMHETGIYWNFIGYFQVAAGLLMFFDRFAPLAALLMMPVTVNIFLVSIALHMHGTPVITALMLCGNVYLLLWHYRKFLPLLQR
jgi:uncharacterized membrane protein YphA (DoxX/SURF4 family)